MSQSTAIIIGAGVTGLSTAYHLAKKKFGRIILIDKGPVGDGSSGRAAAIITGLLWTETGVRARKIALQRYRELSNELPGYQFQAVGCLNWFDPASWPERQKLLSLYDRCDVPYEILNAAEMNQRWPALKPPEDFIGLYDPFGGYSEPDEYIPALANQCRRLGVEILEWTPVEAILNNNGRARGVKTTNNGVIESDVVICTSYAWTNEVLRSVGIALPLKTFVHQRYITRPLAESVDIPAINANPLNGYIRPAIGKRLLLGIETADRDDWKVNSRDFHMKELTVDPTLRDILMQSFRPVVPALENASWEAERVGLLGFAIDNEPVIGPVKSLEGLFIGAAFHSGGFAYNPASGLLLAELVADGKTQIDVSTFSPNRFDRQETESYLSATVQQKNAARRRH
jgi:glycine/D-amino acid oxidase-like deaminating enzyme